MKSFIIIPAFVGIFSINFLIDRDDSRQFEFVRLENSLNYIQAMSRLDQHRQNARQKVLRIIERFNPGMAYDLKQQIADEVYEMSIKYPNLDLDLICATITHESGRTWDPGALSKAGALGLMQIMPSTGKWLANVEGIPWNSAEETLYDPIYNIRLGTRYLSTLIDMYDLEGGLAAYNGGRKRAAMWLANNKADGILWAETRDYIPFVLKLYDEFKSSTL